MRRSFIALCVLAVALAGCGGDDDTSTETAESDTGDSTASSDSDTTESTVPDGCPAEPFTAEIQLDNEFAGEPSVPLTTMEIVDTFAIQIDEAGSAFTIYLADYELDRAAFDDPFYTPEPGDGQTLVTVFVTAFNAEEALAPLAAGDVVTGSSEFDTRVLNVIAQQGAALYNSGNPDGQIEILAVDDSYLCAAIDYFDLVDPNDPASAQQKIVRGSFTAEVTLWPLAD